MFIHNSLEYEYEMTNWGLRLWFIIKIKKFLSWDRFAD